MEEDQSIQEDSIPLGQEWATSPRVEGGQTALPHESLSSLETSAAFTVASIYYNAPPYRHPETMVSPTESWGRATRFSPTSATTLSEQLSLTGIFDYVPSPPEDATPSSSRFTCPIPSTSHPSFLTNGCYWWNTNNPPVYFRPSAHTAQVLDHHYHASTASAFSPDMPMLGGELVSSPVPATEDLPPLHEEVVHTSTGSYSHSSSSESIPMAYRTIDYEMSAAPHQVSGPFPGVPPGEAKVVTILPVHRRYTGKSCRQSRVEGQIIYEDGCRLDKAKLGADGSGITDHDKSEVAFPNKTFGQKVSFRTEFDDYGSYTCQLNVTRKRGQPTKARFAARTADFMEGFLEECKRRGKPFPCKLNDLVLLRIELVSKASVEPIFDLSPTA